jgi:hypothetical protein
MTTPTIPVPSEGTPSIPPSPSPTPPPGPGSDPWAEQIAAAMAVVREDAAAEAAATVRQDEVTIAVEGAKTPETPGTSNQPPSLIPAEIGDISFEDGPKEEPGKSEAPPPADGKPAATTATTTTTTPPAATTPASPPSSDDDPNSDFSKEEESNLLRTARGRRMLATFKSLRDLDKDPDQGGLGYTPQANEVIEWRDAYFSQTQLREDFQANPAQFLINLFGPIQVTDPVSGEPRKALTPESRAVISQIPQVFKEHAPGHYNALAGQILNDHVGILESMAADPAQAANKEKYEYAAKVLKHVFFRGEWSGGWSFSLLISISGYSHCSCFLCFCLCTRHPSRSGRGKRSARPGGTNQASSTAIPHRNSIPNL